MQFSKIKGFVQRNLLTLIGVAAGMVGGTFTGGS